MNKVENTLSIEMYISWKNKRYALKDFIEEALKEIDRLNNIIKELKEGK